MTRGGKRDGAGRKPTEKPTKCIVKRLSIEEVEKLNNYDQLVKEVKEKANCKSKIEDFKIYKLKGELVIKVEDLIKAGLITKSDD